MRYFLIILFIWHTVLLAESEVTEGKPIVARTSSPVFQVALEAPGATGYTWFVSDYDTQWIEAKGCIHKPTNANPKVMGAPMMFVCQFSLTKNVPAHTPLMTLIEFNLIRPWESSSGKIYRQRVLIYPNT